MGKRGRRLVGAAVVLLLVGCKDKGAYVAAPPARVTVATPVQRTLARTLEATGSAAAVDSVDLVARVQGFVQEIRFKDGDEVAPGQVLFVIEPAPFQAKLNQAIAAEGAAQATLAQTQAEFQRQSQLGHSDFASQAAVDQARAAQQSAIAGVAQAKASTELARIDLGYTSVAAPFAGIATARQVSLGALVGANGPSKLASVVQLDPVHVGFAIDETEAQRIRAALAERGQTVRSVGNIPVEAGLQTEAGFPHAGRLDYVDPSVDQGTGTVTVRAVFDNADRALLPGAFVRVRLPTRPPAPTLLVPDAALGADQLGRYLLVVGEGEIVQQRHVVAGPLMDGLRVIDSGLAATDRVVVGGLTRALPGQKVVVVVGPGPGAP